MILFFFAALLVVAGVIFLIVRLTRNNNMKTEKTEKPFKFTISFLFKIYLYVISFVTLLIAVYGGSLLIKAGSSYLFGIQFSYDTYSVSSQTGEYAPADDSETTTSTPCYNGKEMSINNQDVCFDENSRKQDLVTGITFFVSMAILFVLHQVALKKVEKKDPTLWLSKIYTFGSLILYSILGVVLIPTAIYQLATHLIYRSTDITLYSAPGTAISFVVLVVPLWVYFLIQTTKMKEED
jgi:hypothetical protein